MPKIGMINLGCAKNQVDGEMLMSKLKSSGFELTDDVGLSDIAIVNTCGFIESAKKESIEEILELATLKKEGQIKKIVVTGCLAERYKEEIMKELPETDGVIGLGGNKNIADYIKTIWQGESVEEFPVNTEMPLSGDRELTTPSYFAYLKVADGCDNRCTYCAIPSIRGHFRSRTKEDVIEEANKLVSNGAKELILIAQDTTRYGNDIYNDYGLPQLLKDLCKIQNLKWIRIMYCYPERVTDDLLDVMASEEKIVKYMDIPLQHVNGNVLKAMNRSGDKESLTALINKIKAKVEGIILRTTFIVGFPGETEEEFEELCSFVKAMKFDRMGCFPYSREEGTPAFDMDNQIDEDVKYRRAEIVTDLQMRICDEENEKYIGKTIEVMVEGFDRYAECFFGRSYMDAPDVDGKIFFPKGEKLPSYGSFVKVLIEEAMDADLMGNMV